MQPDADILFEKAAGIATITMNRPHVYNAVRDVRPIMQGEVFSAFSRGGSGCGDSLERDPESAVNDLLVNRLKVRPKMSVDSPCVDPSPKFFRGRRVDTTSTL